VIKIAAILGAALLAACASVPQNGNTAPAAVASMRGDPQRLIVLAVANNPEAAALRAGSTLRGYETVPRYAETDTARATLDAIAADYGLHEVSGWPIRPLKMQCVVFAIPEGAARDTLLAQLANDRRVQLAQPLATFTTLSSAYNDPYFDLQRGFATIDAAEAHQWSHGDGVKVAIIDTGIDVAHPDLRGRIGVARDFAGGAIPASGERHGTEVAGIIAADANNHEGIVGIAPGVDVLALRACWQLTAASDNAQCNSFTLAKALTAAFEADAKVVNLSLGGPADPLLTQLIEYGLRHHVVVVGALPPDGRADGFPVGIPGVIAVDADGAVHGANALRAPGREVLTLTPGGRYDFVSGSSMAAAHVSGAIALLLAAGADLDGPQAYALLERSSLHDNASDIQPAIINACKALAALKQSGSCTASSQTAAAVPARVHQ
jgi:subtilisin family serine protease